MEGKEARFGIAASALFAAVTTATSSGAVNTMHDSMTPLGGFVPLFLMQLGEVAPGGVGTGLYSILMFAILGVFIAGLMIGRTPEYLGKKIEAFEMKMASIFILTTPFMVLIGTAVAVVTVARQGRRRRIPARTASARFCMRSPRPPTTTAARSRGLSANTRLLQRRDRACDVDRPLLADCGGARHRRARWRQRSGSRSPRARCRRMGRCSSCC